MGGEIGREHEGCDQREIRLRRPIEENPADNGGARRISLLHTSNARVRSNHRHARNILITRRRFAYTSRNHIALAAATTPFVFSRARGGILMTWFTSEQRRIFAGIMLAVACCLPAAAQEQRRGFYTPPAADTVHAVVAEHGMVVAQERIAAQIGADVLRRGGNAIDAAVATGFAMAVTYPRAGNIGGGGFMIIHSAERREDIAIDYRETAPAATTRDIFLGADGKPDIAKSRDCALGIGVPGTVAGLVLALDRYGSGNLTLADLLKPAIDLAREGFIITDDSADTLPDWHRRLARWPSSAKIFSRADGTSLREGDRLVQTDLAATLSAIAEQGPRGFYEGPVAEKLTAGIRDAGGIMTTEDLKSYQATVRAPVRGTYRGYDIISMPQPSSEIGRAS